MEISRQRIDNILVVRLNGRLDANWCQHVEGALAVAVREGEHHVHLDMADVTYLSSAGLRVLLMFYKQLRSINGVFGVTNPSKVVESILELSGMSILIAPSAGVATRGDEGRVHQSANADYQIFSTGVGGEVRVTPIGDATMLTQGSAPSALQPFSFGENSFALGVGALGGSYDESAARFGELLAISGSAAFQPADGSSRADFVVSEGSLVPEGHLLLGLMGQGAFSTLARFEAGADARTVLLSELAETALELSGTTAVAVIGITETAGLVGAALRQSPALPPAGETLRFGFPQIRDWLSFTSERAYRDSTSLVVGVAARPGSSLDPLLRPLGRGSELLGHFHAAAFPYRPLRKGRIDLKQSVSDLFDGHALQAVLHLLADTREFNGAGESEFYRGALWIAPISKD